MSKHTTGNPDWVLGKVVDGDVTRNDQFDYEVYGAKAPCTDAVYALEDAGYVTLDDDGSVHPTDAGRALDDVQRPVREAARRAHQEAVTAGRVAALLPHRATIERMAAAGKSDKEIGAVIGFRPYRVQHARNAWNATPANNQARHAALHNDTTIRPNLIQQVTDGQARYTQLNMAERVELYIASTNGGMTPNRFGSKYRLSGTQLRHLREAAQARTAEVLAA